MPLDANNMRVIDRALRDVPVDSRVAAIVLQIIEQRQAIQAITGLMAVIGAMSKHLSLVQKVTVAEALRDTADIIERLGRG